MSNNRHVYVDFHVIQTLPPSCVNRDDTGSPKTATFGGVTRARVSSQSWKHAVREMFREEFPEESVGIRTKKVLELLTAEIEKRVPGTDAGKLASKALETAGIKLKENKKSSQTETEALFFISRGQIAALTEIAVEHQDGEMDKECCQQALLEAPSIDIALFGRMVATKENGKKLNFDAAAQVAHAISTHAVRNEYDYFTAVDDCAPEDNAGAGHLGTVEFNSSTMYRYATVNVAELAQSMKEDTARVVRGFADAFIRSMPTGKQNTFANRTRPDAIYVAVRGDQPVNFAAAFEKPVTAGQNGYVQGSVNALVSYAQETYRDYLDAPEAAFAVGEALRPLAEPDSLRAMLDNLEAWVAKHVNEVI